MSLINMSLIKKLAATVATVVIVSGCEYKGSCGKSYENVDYSTVHFGYDQDHLTTHAKMKLDKQYHSLTHADIAHMKKVHVLIEGHTDERGAREYNMGLGARRANAVKTYLMSKGGLDGVMLETVSYGKERPMDPGHNEAAWAKNRRAVTKVDHHDHHKYD